MMLPPPAPLVLMLDTEALKANWQWLAQQSGSAACGAAVKADGYGLGAAEVVHHLRAAGCRHFFVATWAEALSFRPHIGDAELSVLHGVREEDMSVATSLDARPVLKTPDQIARWRDADGGACDIMIDTGMNRLGLDPNTITRDMFEGLTVEVAMSHLACADEDHPLNMVQPMVLEASSPKPPIPLPPLDMAPLLQAGRNECSTSNVMPPRFLRGIGTIDHYPRTSISRIFKPHLPINESRCCIPRKRWFWRICIPCTRVSSRNCQMFVRVRSSSDLRANAKT